MITDERLKAIYETAAPAITCTEESWKEYLRFGSTIYKHRFDNALLVYAQSPKATTLGTYDTWRKVGRYVNKGEKGIAVCEYFNAETTIRHLFDVSQTSGKTLPAAWKLNGEQRQEVADRLARSHQVKASNFIDCIGQITVNNIAGAIGGYLRGFENDIEGHLFASIPQDGFVAELTENIFNSCLYFIASRCGEAVDVSVPTITRFDNVPLIQRLGHAVTELSKAVLLEIENNVKVLARERGAASEQRTVEQRGTTGAPERTERGRHAGTPRRAAREVREDGDEAHARNRHPEIFTFADAGRAYEHDVPSGRGSVGDGRLNHEEDGRTSPDPENGRQHGDNAALEQAEGHGNRDCDQRIGDDPEIAENAKGPRGLFSLPETEKGTDAPQVGGGQIATGRLLFSGAFRASGAAQLSLFTQEPPRTLEAAGQPFISPEVSGGVIEIPDAGDRRAGISTEDAHPQEKIPQQTLGEPEKENYRYSEADNLFVGGAKTKFRNNIEAIRLMKHLETEGRPATQDEQKALANYVGWGGIANAFSKNASGWENEYRELRLTLDDDEYRAAMNSTVTAFYTVPRLAEWMHNIIGSFGFKGGADRRILEPSMGTGNFFAVLPEHLNGTKLYGVELDSITGRIARQLYPNADIRVQGFETTSFDDDSVDIVIGNIPFNNYKIYDRRYENENFYIHDYFIAKSLNLLKPGGIAAFITSKGTMDKNDTAAREYFARRADLIGAVRLPNNTFTALSGTEVTADILFFKKLDQARDIEKKYLPDWVKVGWRSQDYLRINQYFIDNPGMMLGEMTRNHQMYGNQDGTACIAPEGQDLFAELGRAGSGMSAVFEALPDQETAGLRGGSVLSLDNEKSKADDGIKNFTYVVKDDGIYFCEGGRLEKRDFRGIKAERIIGLCGIRDALLDVIGIQSRESGYLVGELDAAQKRLNETYDAFVQKYGYVNATANAAVFREDDQYPLLRSIEALRDDGETYSKCPIFTMATIKPYRQPTRADSAKEALEISLNVKLKVDLEYMAYLYEKSEDDIIAELGDRIFLNPQNFYSNPYEGWETAEEYLSGDVVAKLDYAKLKTRDYEMFSRNVEALERVQPAKLLPSDIDFRIGSPWIPIEYYRQFMYDTFETPPHLKPANYASRGRVELEYLEHTDSWRISNKTAIHESVKANQTFGTDRANAYEIYEDSLNMRPVTVRDPAPYTDDSGNERIRYSINPEQTTIARSKQQQVKETFATWLFADKERTETLLDIYNERFNRIRPREYDGSHLRFYGMSEEMELRKHQKDVIARIVYNGTCLMAHEVGAGKTAAMAAAGMYMKNMGVIKKPLYVVPNHLTGQWANEFLRFFPSANVFVTTKNDFEKKNRQRFISRIATGDYDAVIIGHSQFKKIPISKDRQARLLNEEISALTRAIEEMKAENGENWAVKQMVIFQNNRKSQLNRLVKDERKDDLLTFEQLGVDYMFVDEAHAFKNLITYTKMRNVAGIGNSQNQRASDMLMKCQYLQEIGKGRGVTFATGTPISNSMSEMFVMQKFLQPGMLKKAGLAYFDRWAATFGDVVSGLEINPEGSGYRIKNRFNKFCNLPELMKMFRVVADIQTGEMLNLPLPEIEGGKAQIVTTERSSFQKEVMESFVKRAEAIRNGSVGREEDNMLKLTNEARLMAIDPRLIHPDAPDDHGSKLNACASKVFSLWQKTADKRLTQVVFCDSGTPKAGQFNVYNEMKEQLIQKGVPLDEIAFVHDAETDAQREAMFEKTRNGEIRILLGSTGKLGTGTNIQTRLFAIHHLDVPWRPADITQRDGRGLRFGNANESINIFRYVTKDTFDSYLWQIQEQKLRFITQIMTNKSVSRSCEDVDETVLTAAEIKAIATSNPMLAEKMSVDNEVARLKLLKGNWLDERLALERSIATNYPSAITRTEERIKNTRADIVTVNSHKSGDFLIEVDGKAYSERVKAGEAMLKVIAARCGASEKDVLIGRYRGLNLYAARKRLVETELKLVGDGRYATVASDSAIGCSVRIENLAEKLPSSLSEAEEKLAEVLRQLEAAKREALSPFVHEERLSANLARQSEIDAQLEFNSLSRHRDEILDETDAVGMAAESEIECENDGIGA
jgi:N12 class adenine-specific DNA methylase